MSLKPALFNQEMARALHLHIKTSTRRPVTPQPYGVTEPQLFHDNVYRVLDIFGREYDISPQYQAGDHIYVRESFCKDAGRFLYRADYSSESKFFVNGREVKLKWKPSIHMPREVARTYLHVLRSGIEQIQDITEDGAAAEGCESRAAFAELWNRLYSSPVRVLRDGEVVGYVSYPWENVRETREYKGKPWEVHGNPWVFVYDFEYSNREEAERVSGAEY